MLHTAVHVKCDRNCCVKCGKLNVRGLNVRYFATESNRGGPKQFPRSDVGKEGLFLKPFEPYGGKQHMVAVFRDESFK